MKTMQSYWIVAAVIGCMSCDLLAPAKKNPQDCTAFPEICKMGEVCDTKTLQCSNGACTTSATCPLADAAACRATACVACNIDAECADWTSLRNEIPPRNFCVTLNNKPTCSQCKASTDCTDVNKPTCGADGLCRPCAADSECPSTICRKAGDYPETPPSQIPGLVTGQCIPDAQIAYVNKDTGNDNNAGTLSAPYQTVAKAISNNKPYIKVAAGNGYPQILLDNTTNAAGNSFIIVGNGRDIGPTVFDSVKVTKGTLVLSSAQINFNSSTNPAVECSTNASSVTLVNTVISNAGGQGINASADCAQLTVDRSRVDCGGTNKVGITAGGVGAVITSYRIVNTSVTACGGNGAVPLQQYGVSLNASANGFFAFNTITGNLRGIICSGSQDISDSIVSLNADAANQVNVCTSTRIVTNLIAGDLMAGSEPKLLNTASTRAKCIDQGFMPTGQIMVPIDYFGIDRPQGNGFDIGFQELQ